MKVLSKLQETFKSLTFMRLISVILSILVWEVTIWRLKCAATNSFYKFYLNSLDRVLYCYTKFT